MCGGTGLGPESETPAQGLSPRVRGNQFPVCLPPVVRRSIPACAGEPQIFSRRLGVGAVYPRVCGGTDYDNSPGDVGYGLSPRVRGNLDVYEPPDTRMRSIPACAGEPPARIHCYRGWAVYPRVCGGTPATPSPRPMWQGLSPRVRGNLPHRDDRRGGSGSIPACAGEPTSGAGASSL